MKSKLSNGKLTRFHYGRSSHLCLLTLILKPLLHSTTVEKVAKDTYQTIRAWSKAVSNNKEILFEGQWLFAKATFDSGKPYCFIINQVVSSQIF